MNQNRLKEYEKFFSDPDKEERLEEQECVLCFYGSKIGGAAMTRANCMSCDKQMGFGSTNVDHLCIECARAHRLCKHCNSDMEYKNRKKL